MTVMSTNTREVDINRLALLAYRYAGLMNEMQSAEGPQWDARSATARDHLELIVDALAAEGIFERSVETYDLSVAAGAASTQLPADTADVRGDARLVMDDGTGNDSPLEAQTRTQYFEIPTKEQEGTPAKIYVSRGAPMYVYLWPVPEADVTVRLQRQRLTYDNSDGSATVDLERFWLDYLLHELAARVALGGGIAVERVALLQAKATSALNKAKGKASGQLPNRLAMGHRAPKARGR